MAVFNPKILDASIRDVTVGLSDDQKADVLLYAMQHLKSESSRTTIENAVQSILQITDLSPANASKARLTRAKARLAAGRRVGAHEDLEAILRFEPDHPEASSLISRRVVTTEKLFKQPGGCPMFSIEIWRQIATFLPRHDLKTCLLVPHILSRVASQLLFQKIDLHFVVWAEEDEWSPRPDPVLDKWHAQRSADILTRVITDPSFASLIKTLRIFAPLTAQSQSMAFQTGMLANALPKMVNLINFHCTMTREGLASVLRVMETAKPRLRGLSLNPTNGAQGLVIPPIKTIKRLSIHGLGDNASQAFSFVSRHHGSIRELSLCGSQCILSTDSLAIRHLTQLDFAGHFPADRQVFAEILANGHQLESLRLSCSLNCSPSSQFRSQRTSVPYLKRFALHITSVGRLATDPDLFPAVSEFLRDRKHLVTLHLTVPVVASRQRLGYDAAVWGVLPSLINLKSIHITLPKDVAPGLATWLIPRGVTSLFLEGEFPEPSELPSFLSQMKPGVPPALRLIGFPKFAVSDVIDLVDRGFPMVRIVRVGDGYWTVVRKPDGTFKDMEEWPRRRAKYNAPEMLEWLGCEDALWPDICAF
ncbi:hypothetical protein JAAARDRAFT_133166 [Jaapia argillacea MUCL 33604]|uniref:Uncharacterized protein n=1 Tax=Jaapia argillacea MUCL 33604 TaxID=933084 RepID=A0A067PQN4_9AGAM|nr:hypothetical protein JAAARDRAFT_133166 [Jaapia argillacea MUCL 33604]